MTSRFRQLFVRTKSTRPSANSSAEKRAINPELTQIIGVTSDSDSRQSDRSTVNDSKPMGDVSTRRTRYLRSRSLTTSSGHASLSLWVRALRIGIFSFMRFVDGRAEHVIE